MLSPNQQELASAWNDVAAWAIHVLMREGLEGVAVAPLARFPVAAQWIIRRESREGDPRRRQLAALLAGALASPARAGHVQGPDPDLLSELLELESRRVLESARSGASDHPDACVSDPGRADDAAAVVSRIVDAAAQWSDAPALRPFALEALSRIVETAVAGEPWTNLERSAMVLARHAPRESRELLGRLHRVLVASHDPAASVVARLLTGETDLIDDDERLRRDAQRAAREYHIGGEARDMLDRAAEAAEQFEAGVLA